MKLEFDKTQFIHKVIVYFRFFTNWYDPNNFCAESEANFKGCVDDGNNVNVAVYGGGSRIKACRKLELTYGLEQSDQIYSLRCNAMGDEVRLSKTTGIILVSEVVVSGKGSCKSLTS